jgi:hypothetical protein
MLVQIASSNPGRIPIAQSTRLGADEIATGMRVEQKLGISLYESPHTGAEFTDDSNKSYDALGKPSAAQFWDWNLFKASIDWHLLKANDFTVIDLTGFTQTQIGQVSAYVRSLSQALQDKIIRINF